MQQVHFRVDPLVQARLGSTLYRARGGDAYYHLHGTMRHVFGNEDIHTYYLNPSQMQVSAYTDLDRDVILDRVAHTHEGLVTGLQVEEVPLVRTGDRVRLAVRVQPLETFDYRTWSRTQFVTNDLTAWLLHRTRRALTVDPTTISCETHTEGRVYRRGEHRTLGNLSVTVADYLFEGRVENSDSFMFMLRRGLGKGRSFGFGMPRFQS